MWTRGAKTRGSGSDDGGKTVCVVNHIQVWSIDVKNQIMLAAFASFLTSFRICDSMPGASKAKIKTVTS